MERYGSARLAVLLAMAFACSMNGVSARDWHDSPWLTTPEPVPGNGRTITLRTDYRTTFTAYLVGPEEAGESILLIHDRFGLNPEVASWADRLAEQGFRVLAVDLYDGRSVLREGMGDFIWSQVDPQWIEADLDAGLSFLAHDQDRISVAAWGRSTAHAIELARSRPGEIAALLLYPGPVTKDLVEGLPWMPMPVFRHPVSRSPFDPYLDSGRQEIADAAFEATGKFLSDRAAARGP